MAGSMSTRRRRFVGRLLARQPRGRGHQRGCRCSPCSTCPARSTSSTASRSVTPGTTHRFGEDRLATAPQRPAARAAPRLILLDRDSIPTILSGCLREGVHRLVTLPATSRGSRISTEARADGLLRLLVPRANRSPMSDAAADGPSRQRIDAASLDGAASPAVLALTTVPAASASRASNARRASLLPAARPSAQCSPVARRAWYRAIAARTRHRSCAWSKP